ncbi:MAG: TlpA family protein disulfide reductase [Thermoanaerobaculia bacterium]
MTRAAAALLLASLGLVPAATAEEPLLTPVDHAAWQEALASHADKIVVVDFWASWCVPCLDRFPAMVELAERYGDRGVVFVALDLDDPGDAGALERAEAFAREQGGRIHHFRSTLPILEAFDKLGLLGIPAVYVYGRDGELARRLTADDPNVQFTDADVEQAVRALLEASPAAG